MGGGAWPFQVGGTICFRSFVFLWKEMELEKRIDEDTNRDGDPSEEKRR